MKKKFNKEDYILSFWVQGVSVFVTDIHLEAYKELQVLYIIDKGVFKQYFTKSACQQMLEQGLCFYSDKDAFDNYKRGLIDHITLFKQFFKKDIYNKNHIDFMIVDKLFSFTKKLCSDYSKMNFEYTDEAFKLRSSSEILRKNLDQVTRFKDQVRGFMNTVLFENDGYVDITFRTLSKQFNIRLDQLHNLTQKEILSLYQNKKINLKSTEKRQEAFVESYNLNGFYEGEKAKEVIMDFRGEVVKVDIIKGRTASEGTVTGSVKVISVDYSDLSKVNKEIDSMKQGDILVAETTAPELMVACKKAAAIVTDIGGLMSHAAIIARELGIPCIVGTQNATKALKDGDEVEVDADRGIVTILKKVDE